MQQFRAEIREPFHVADRDGPHVSVVVRAGLPGQGALCGTLTMRRDEAEEFVSALAKLHLMAKAVEAAQAHRENSLSAAYCPDCGCDWEDINDPHQEGCTWHPFIDALDAVDR